MNAVRCRICAGANLAGSTAYTRLAHASPSAQTTYAARESVYAPPAVNGLSAVCLERERSI